jgi:hypothetical protein
LAITQRFPELALERRRFRTHCAGIAG